MVAVNGSVVLVTGGGRGLGRALVKAFLAAGAAKVYATARTPVPSDDPRIVPLALEVTDAHAVAAVAAIATDVTIVVNNAGAMGPGPLLTSDLADIRELFEVNVFAPVLVAQQFAPILAANGGGALVDIHSALSWIASGSYGASKAALWSVTNALRVELEGQGTQVVGVHLGYTDTDMIAALDVPKNDPRQVAADVVAVVADGGHEVLADEVSRQVKQLLSGPVEQLRLG